MIGFAMVLKTGFLCSGNTWSVMAHERPIPAVIWTNSFAPVLCISSINAFSSRNIFLFCHSHLFPSVSLIGAMPGIIRPTLLLALSRKNFAASLSKWFGSIQPNRDVPPIGHNTIRFLISTLPTFHGVKSGSYFSFILPIDSFPFFSLKRFSFFHDIIIKLF